MLTVLVELRAGAAGRRLLELGPADTVRFGRGAENLAVDLVLADPAVARVAGEITAAEDYWCLTNCSRSSTYVVENPEGAGEHIKIAPGRIGAPVPFEIARVVLPGQDAPVHFQVFAPRHAYLDHADDSASGSRTVAAYSLDTSAKYFLVLVALCEPRLRDESAFAIPTAAAVVQRLRALPSCHDLTTDAVNFHIDYLAREKLRLRSGSRARVPESGNSRREALVSMALRFDMIQEHHLALLPPRPRTRIGDHAG